MTLTSILSPTTVDRSSPVPLYFQLKDTLLTLIQEGKFKEGDLIPTERELGEKFQVSRITVRRAIDELSRKGYLATQQGKGTFVTKPKIERSMRQMKSFSTAIMDEGHYPGSRLLSLRHEQATREVASFLNIDEGDWVWAVERLRFADDEPLGLSLVYLNLPPDVFLTPAELDQEVSLWSILEKKGVTLAESEESIQAILADEQQAELLQVKVGFPLLLVEGVVYNEQTTPIEYHQVFNLGDRYKYSLQIIRQAV